VSIVEKIQERGYVKKTNIEGTTIERLSYEWDGTMTTVPTKHVIGSGKNQLQITHVGIIVIEFLIKYFDQIFNYEYTRNLEDNWDRCEEYSRDIDNSISSMDAKKEEIQIDEKNKIIVGRNGTVMITKDTNGTVFTKIKQTINLDRLKNGEYNMEEIVDRKDSLYKGMYMNEEIFVKKGRYGNYTTWQGKNVSLNYFKKVPIEKITLENIIWTIENR